MNAGATFDASAQRLLDLGLAGVVIIGLVAAVVFLWRARESDRARADARYEDVQEKRVAEQATALAAISTAEATVETTIQTLTRSQ